MVDVSASVLCCMPAPHGPLASKLKNCPSPGMIVKGLGCFTIFQEVKSASPIQAPMQPQAIFQHPLGDVLLLKYR